MFQILSTPQSPSLHSHCLLGSHERISLPTLQNLCATGAQIRLSWMVPIPLQHRNQSLGSPTQRCRQGHYWVPLFHPLLPTPSWGSTPSSKADFRTSGPFLLRTCSASTPWLIQPLCPGNKKRALSTKEETTLLEITLFFGHSIPPIPTWDSDYVLPFPPWTATHFTVSPFIPDCTLYRQQYSPTPVSFKQTILPPLFWYPNMGWWFCLLRFGPGGAGV